MLLPTASCLAALALLAGPSLLAADPPTTAAAGPTIWKIDQTTVIAGHAVTVLGAPCITAGPDGAAVRFDGARDGLLVPVNPLAGWSAFTVEVLFLPEESGGAEQRFVHVEDTATWRVMIETRLDGKGGWWLDTFLGGNGRRHPLIDPQRVHPTGRWYWAALTCDGKHMTHFINGEKELETDAKFGPMVAGQSSLGMRQNRVFWFKGSIRELRFHPTALAPAQLQRSEGK